MVCFLKKTEIREGYATKPASRMNAIGILAIYGGENFKVYIHKIKCQLRAEKSYKYEPVNIWNPYLQLLCYWLNSALNWH